MAVQDPGLQGHGNGPGAIPSGEISIVLPVAGK